MNYVLHQNNDGNWHLCDRSYNMGKRRHIILEAYGKEEPVLYQLKVESGVAEEKLPQLAAESFDLVYIDPPYDKHGDGRLDKAVKVPTTKISPSQMRMGV